MNTSSQSTIPSQPISGWFNPLNFFRSAVSCWNNFWFKAEDRSLSLACCRIFVGITLLLSLLTPGRQGAELSFGEFFQAQNPELFHPVGIWQIFGNVPPTEGFVTLLIYAGYISAICMILGLFTRVSMCVATISACFLFALLYCYRHMWAHGYNTGLLALVAIAFTPAGARLSLDSLLFKQKRNSEGTIVREAKYRWGVLLVQIAVTTVFFNAAYWKLEASTLSLEWAFSDNFRNQIWHRFPWMGQTTPELAMFIMGSPFLYKGLAFGNLFTQAISITAAFLMNRPFLRAFVGAFFVLEVLGLNFLMQLNFLHWIPLYGIFIDWERVFAFFGKKEEKLEVTSPSTLSFLWGNLFVIGFLSFSLFLAFNPRPLIEEWSTYPFSRYSMFSGIRAKEPYNVPQSYEDVAIRYEVIGNQETPDALTQYLNRRHKSSVKIKTIDKLKNQLIYIKTLVEDRKKDVGFKVEEITLHKVLLQVPPYPEKPDTKTLLKAKMGTLKKDGSFVGFVGDRGGECVRSQLDNSIYKNCIFTIDWAGYENPEIKLRPINLLNEDLPDQIEWLDEKSFRFETPRDKRYLIEVEVTDSNFPGETHRYLLWHTSSA